MNKRKLILCIIADICFLGGVIFKFAMTGRDYLGYGLIAIAAVLLLYEGFISRGMKKAVIGLSVILAVGCVVFAVAEAQVISEAKTDKDIETDYIIVLGAGVRGTTPSATMLDRLKATLDYMTEHEEVVAIVSGGQGEGEDISEAEAMEKWLEDHGVEKERIITEDKSTSTKENIKNSLEIMKKKGAELKEGVAIVSSEYHMYRAKEIAEDLGVKAYGIAAETGIETVKVNYFIREAFGAVYNMLFSF